MNRADDFENWLMEYHSENNPEILDDMLPDCFNDWVCDLDSDEWIRLGNLYAKRSDEKRLKALRDVYEKWRKHNDMLSQKLEVGDVTTRRGSDDAVVQRHHVRSLGASAAVACAADAIPVDLRPRLQIVYASHAIPYLERCCVSAKKDTADTNHSVCSCAPQLG